MTGVVCLVDDDEDDDVENFTNSVAKFKSQDVFPDCGGPVNKMRCCCVVAVVVVVDINPSMLLYLQNDE